MSTANPPISDIPTGLSLRGELSLRNIKFASSYKYLHELTDGEIPSVIFGRDEEGRHGNFHAAAYKMICNDREWARRLNKVHTAYKRARPRSDWEWKELDCSHSSDALLMNIFCYPEVTTRVDTHTLLGVDRNVIPEFGFKPRTPLQNGKSDTTEIDLRLGELFIEAKLMESDFQCADSQLISRYRDLEIVFTPSELPTRNGRQSSYQLIRGVLAAYANKGSFCVFCDARRPDLIEAWYRVMSAVRLMDFRWRLKLLTWQELSKTLPKDLQDFLIAKYGIFPSI